MVAADDKCSGQSDGGGDDSPHEYSSPPCYLHELDPAYMGNEVQESMAWPAVREWRREQRRRLTELRNHMPDTERVLADRDILQTIDKANIIDAIDTGIYWPLQGEFDSRPLMERVLDVGGSVAIPVIVDRDAPLEFWRLDRHAGVSPQGPWNIPAPAQRCVVDPAVLFIPVVGFDVHAHRLGNGGGYFDRTLAALSPRPMTIGIGYDFARLESIHAQDHDVPLDAIVTEKGIFWRER